MTKQKKDDKAEKIDIVYYTDPLCAWSWAMEPAWRRMIYQYGPSIDYRYCMSGLLADWKFFNDTINCVSRPVQMAPFWNEIAHRSGMPVNSRLWLTDPPSSSYPACVAVKAASLQSKKAEELMLRVLRKSVLAEGKNIAKPEQLFSIGKQLNNKFDGELFNLENWMADVCSGPATALFRLDLQEVQLKKINRFPSITMRYRDRHVLLTGFRPFSELLRVLKNLANDLPLPGPINESNYSDFWFDLTERELIEIRN